MLAGLSEPTTPDSQRNGRYSGHQQHNDEANNLGQVNACPGQAGIGDRAGQRRVWSIWRRNATEGITTKRAMERAVENAPAYART